MVIDQIGPTGGDNGYSAITGHVGWGIAWYINGLLIPEIYVVRGKTYTFVVEGGDDKEFPAGYHPFYITDDPEGGYEFKSERERRRSRVTLMLQKLSSYLFSTLKVFAGVEQTRFGGVVPSATGRLCEWKEDDKQPANFFTSFGAYQRSLSLFCQEGEIHATATAIAIATTSCDVWSMLQGNPASSSGPRTGTRQTRSTTSASLTGSSAGRSTWWTGVTSERPEDNCDDSSDQQCLYVNINLKYLFYL